jgi:hypothetical protein
MKNKVNFKYKKIENDNYILKISISEIFMKSFILKVANNFGFSLFSVVN